MKASKTRDHGGGLDAAVARYGGVKSDWLDLSTGINPVPYPVPDFSSNCWETLPDQVAVSALENAARNFWNIPDEAAVLAAPGASSLIARIPALMPASTVTIPGPTYNEHEAAFRAENWTITGADGQASVIVHPNNPDGHLYDDHTPANRLTVVDESFGDVASSSSLINLSTRSGVVILKSFGKFWGLAGARLGFAIGDPALISKLAQMLGPWPVSGPALALGTAALNDPEWADATRKRLTADAARLDKFMVAKGANVVGGTSLFRLYDVEHAQKWQDKLARAHIWSRVFPYSDKWLRLGLPAPHQWAKLESAL